LGCLYCGARIIQHLATLPISPQDCARRRRSELALWVSHGHSEAQIRALAKGDQAPLQPETPQPDSKTPKPRR